MRESASFLSPQHGHVLGGDLRAAQQHRGGTGDGGEGGAQVVGHRPEDVAPMGLPGGLQLDGRLLGVEPLVQLVQGLVRFSWRMASARWFLVRVVRAHTTQEMATIEIMATG